LTQYWIVMNRQTDRHSVTEHHVGKNLTEFHLWLFYVTNIHMGPGLDISDKSESYWPNSSNPLKPRWLWESSRATHFMPRGHE